jgi:hypothetical protein
MSLIRLLLYTMLILTSYFYKEKKVHVKSYQKINILIQTLWKWHHEYMYNNPSPLNVLTYCSAVSLILLLTHKPWRLEIIRVTGLNPGNLVHFIFLVSVKHQEVPENGLRYPGWGTDWRHSHVRAIMSLVRSWSLILISVIRASFINLWYFTLRTSDISLRGRNSW